MTGGITISSLELNPQNPLRRKSPRPEHLRGPDYEEQYDYLTVFYDCFRTADGDDTIMLGPPLFNLKRTVLRTLRSVYGLPWYSRIPLSQFDRHSQLRLGRVDDVDLPNGLFLQNHLVIQANFSEIFRGRRVALTMSRNNELQWIKDWAHFFARKHGADAILIYDNASTKYGSDEVREAISSVPGIAIASVVDWPYKFGPSGIIGQPWDSDFCQYGALEHARYRLLAYAQAVVNADIDELPITSGGESLFDIVRRSSTGYLEYEGQWVGNASLSPEANTVHRRHKHYIHRLTTAPSDVRDVISLQQKWAVVPARCPPEAQWQVHYVTQMTPDPLSSLVRFRHFRPINSNWYGERWRPEAPNERDYVVDEELMEWMQMFNEQ